MANNVQLDQLRRARDNGNLNICSKKIEELARSKARYEKIIQEAAHNNDIDTLGKIVFEAISTLETSEFLCGNPTKGGQPNMEVKILSYPKLRGDVAAFARRGTQPKRIVPSASSLSIRHPQISSSRKTMPRPHSTPAPHKDRRQQQMVKNPNRTKSVESNRAAPVPVRRTQSRRSESSVSFQQPLHRRDDTPRNFDLRNHSQGTPRNLSGRTLLRKSKGVRDRVAEGAVPKQRFTIPSEAQRQLQENIQMSDAQPERRLRSPGAASSNTSAQEAQRQIQENIQMSNAQPQRRLRSPGAVSSNASARSLTTEQREMIAIRNQKIQNDLEISKRLGRQRRLDAEKAATTADKFGAQGRKTTLPTTDLKNTEITEEGNFYRNV